MHVRDVLISLISSLVLTTLAVASESLAAPADINNLSDDELAYSLGSKPGVNRVPGILAPPVYDDTQIAEPAAVDESD